jgi:hypothetical protein
MGCSQRVLSLPISHAECPVCVSPLKSGTRWRLHWTRGRDEDSTELGDTVKSVGRLVPPLPLARRVIRIDQQWTTCCRLDRAGSLDVLVVCRLDRCLIGRSRSYWRWWFLWKRSWVMRRVHCASCQSSNILKWKRHVYKGRKRWSSKSSLNVDDHIVTNKVLNTRGFRQEHMNARWFLLLHYNCVSVGIVRSRTKATELARNLSQYHLFCVGGLTNSQYT